MVCPACWLRTQCKCVISIQRVRSLRHEESRLRDAALRRQLAAAVRREAVAVDALSAAQRAQARGGLGRPCAALGGVGRPWASLGGPLPLLPLVQLINLAEEWLSTFLPHCLQKIDRVSFGLLSMEEMRKAQKLDPHMPRSRLKLAIPFLGKDVPSAASEFAHPDIIIGLTVLAYRYEGLRKVDFEQDLIALLRSNFENESGPYRLRPSSLMYNTWVEQAGGRTKGAEPKPKTAAAAVLAPAGEQKPPEDVPVLASARERRPLCMRTPHHHAQAGEQCDRRACDMRDARRCCANPW